MTNPFRRGRNAEKLPLVVCAFKPPTRVMPWLAVWHAYLDPQEAAGPDPEIERLDPTPAPAGHRTVFTGSAGASKTWALLEQVKRDQRADSDADSG